MHKIMTRRNFLIASASAAGGLALYSNDVSRHELTVTYPTFLIDNLSPAFHGFRFVQISDLHLEEYTEDFVLRRVIRRVNQLKPDMVLITGDFISRGPMSIGVSYSAAARCAELLTGLECPLRYGILGNHDAAVGSSVIRGHMEYNGLPMLVNEYVRIERNGEHLFLCGLDDIAYGSPNLEDAIPAAPDAPVILMAHEPDYADTIATHPRGPLIDLILSGHTHGGQIRIPGFRPLALPVLGKHYAEGHFQVGSSQLYVNRGIGTVGIPFRLNCPPEITLGTLMPA
jgi:predicted MPP superfamily phosphohydrolase